MSSKCNNFPLFGDVTKSSHFSPFQFILSEQLSYRDNFLGNFNVYNIKSSCFTRAPFTQRFRKMLYASNVFASNVNISLLMTNTNFLLRATESHDNHVISMARASSLRHTPYGIGPGFCSHRACSRQCY